MLDRYLQGLATRISPEAPIPVVNIKQEHYRLGAAANVALNLCALGAQAQLCGVIGEDSHAKTIRTCLNKKGIPLYADPGSGYPRTIVKTRIIANNQQICRLDYEDQPEAYQLHTFNNAAQLKKITTGIDAIILSDYAKGVISTPLIATIRQTAQSQGVLVAIDPKPKSQLHYHGLDLMTPNREESYQLADLPYQPHAPLPAEAICARIYERYQPQKLIITLGSEGMLLSTKDRPLNRIPTYAREAFDVSGAGDTVIAALTLSLIAGADLETAARFANTAAGVVLTKLGAATATPEEILTYHNNTAEQPP